MAKSRIGYGVWFLLTLLLYLWSDSWAALFLVTVTVLMAVFSGISVLLMKNKVECSFEIRRMTGKKKPVRGILCLTNKGLLPIPRAGCRLRILNRVTGEEKLQPLYCSLPAAKTERVEWDLSSDYCGNIRITVESLKCFDIFGMFCVREETKVKGQVIVLPDIFQTEVVITESNTANWESVTYSSVKKGDDSSEIFGIREYVEGDSPKNIHWKLSGKLDNLYVKELSLPVENSILVVYETGILGEQPEKPAVRDAMMEAFLSVSQSLISEGHIHALAWYDQEKERFTCEEVTSEDDLAAMTGGLLAVKPGKNGYSSLHYYLQEYIENPFAHILYVTAQQPGEELDRLMQFCTASVLLCREKLSEKEQEAQGTHLLFSPDNMEEALCQLII